MPPKKKEPAEKDLYLYVIEADQEKGINEEFIGLVNKLVSDKIFAERRDAVCIRRHDELETFEYESASWDLLRGFVEDCSKSAEKPPNIVECLSAGCNSILEQSAIDEYSTWKLLYFGNFKSSLVDGAALKKLRSQVEENDIKLTILFPVDVPDMSSLQKENFDLINTLVGSSENFYVFTYTQAITKILNMIVKKEKGSMPWKIVFEIAPGIEIPVKKLIINRKNTNSFKSNYRSEGVHKETMWTSNDGSVVDESEIGEAYSYGDCLVSASDVESGKSYETGNACFQLLQFTPRDNIQPAYLCGDGTDIFFAQDFNPEAAVKLDALMKAMINTNRVAIVRKIWRKNSKASMGVLVPDLERQGLIYSDICYADDISTPYFPPLVKEETEGSGISDKDDVIDELIKTKSLKEFNPEKGPVDPSELVLREAVTSKLVNQPDQDVKDVKPKSKVRDNIGLFFEQFILSDTLVNRLTSTFPLKVNKESGADRPSGYQIFRKRGRKNEGNENGTEKKVKVEEAAVPEGNDDDVKLELPEEDIDNLLDEL